MEKIKGGDSMTEKTLDRRFYQKMGVCPVCRKESLFGDEKECPECRVIKYIESKKFRAKHPDYHAKRRMNLYKNRVANHECTYCGKPLDDDYKFRMCVKCRIKQNNYLRLSRERRGQGGV